MLSAVIHPRLSYSAMHLAAQLTHQRSVHPGPLVLGTALLNSLTPSADRDRPVSRRSEPSSRTTLMGEQPNPWDLLQPQDVRADIEVPILPVDVNSWGRLACYPRGSFYPMSHSPSTRCYRITNADFRLCSTCPSRSQAPLCVCTLRLVSIQPEGTFARLRYSLGGDRPSQTAHLTLSPLRITEKVRAKT